MKQFWNDSPQREQGIASIFGRRYGAMVPRTQCAERRPKIPVAERGYVAPHEYDPPSPAQTEPNRMQHPQSKIITKLRNDSHAMPEKDLLHLLTMTAASTRPMQFDPCSRHPCDCECPCEQALMQFCSTPCTELRNQPRLGLSGMRDPRKHEYRFARAAHR